MRPAFGIPGLLVTATGQHRAAPAHRDAGRAPRRVQLLPRLTLAVLLCAGCPVAPAASLPSDGLQDGDFERPGLQIRKGSADGEWSAIVHREGTGAIAVAQGEGRNGTCAARYQKTDPLSQNIHVDQVVPVIPHTIYQVTAWVRGDGALRPGLVVYTPDWDVLAATVTPSLPAEWTEIRLAFDPGSHDRVRLAWIPGLLRDRHEASPGVSFLDDVALTPLASPPAALRQALDLNRSREGEEVDLTTVRHAPVAQPAELLPIRCRDGVLVYPDGSEVALWGANLQTPLAWEYHNRLKAAGVPLEIAALNEITDRNLAELGQLGCDLVRVHLCPSDFTDGRGELKPTIYLEALDHLLARCAETRTRVFLTLINDMNQRTCADSFIVDQPREKWLFDPVLLDRLEVYVRSLLTRRNPVSKRIYATEPALAAIEISNEPAYPSWPDLLLDPDQAFVRSAFETWRTERKLDAWPDAAFTLWRYETVRAAIGRLTTAIRSAGAEQPVFWNLNWPGMIREREDVFQAVADSPVDGVSFCLYPGQQDVRNPFWANPVNLDDRNYLPFLRENLRHYDKLRWLLGKRFQTKAKAVYEFETFYTQNGHLYPAMARLMRTLGAQLAPMWTYTLTPSAERHSGSHHLNLYCTPRKAVSFAIAGRLFRDSPRHSAYPESDDQEIVFDNRCLVSFPKDLSVYRSGNTLLHSRSIEALPFSQDASPIRHVMGCGSSPLVQYDGSGIYTIQAGPETISLQINPDATFLRPHWQKPPPRGSAEKTCSLDWNAPHRMKLSFPDWPGDICVEQILDGRRTRVPGSSRVPEFSGAPGLYEIWRQAAPAP